MDLADLGAMAGGWHIPSLADTTTMTTPAGAWIIITLAAALLPKHRRAR